MSSAARALTAVFLLFTLSLPLTASAANVFGGRVGGFFPCFNAALWTTVGPPRGGVYIWTPGTRTYPNGPPGPGRYTLGLYGIPYFCIVTIFPLFVLPGIAMTMEASSGGAAPAAPAPAPSAPTQTTIVAPPVCNGVNGPNCTIVN